MQTKDNHMSPDWPQALQNILQNRRLGHLQQLMRHAERLVLINNLLRQQLSDQLREHCQVMHSTPTELIIAVDSAVWLTQLRFLQTELLQQLQQYPQFIHLNCIKLRINPIQSTPFEFPPQPRDLSLANKDLFRGLASEIKDEKLRSALQKLAR